MDIVEGQVGPEAKYDLKFEGGKLKMQLDYAGAMGSAGLYGAVGVDQLIDAVKAAIPGQVDDMVLDLLKAALKAV